MSARQTAEQLKKAVLNYYDGEDYFPNYPIKKTEAYSVLTKKGNIRPLHMYNGSVVDYIYENPSSLGADGDVGSNSNSNTVPATNDVSYQILIPSSATDYTGDTMAIKSAVALSTLAGSIPFGGGIIYEAGMGVANILIANLLGKIIGESLYSDEPAIFTFNTIVNTIGYSKMLGLTTVNGKVPIYYLFDKLGNFVPYVQEELIPALTFYQHKRIMLKDIESISFPTVQSGGTFTVSGWLATIDIYTHAFANSTIKYSLADDVKTAVNKFLSDYADNAVVIHIFTNFTGSISHSTGAAVILRAYTKLHSGDNFTAYATGGSVPGLYYGGDQSTVTLSLYGVGKNGYVTLDSYALGNENSVVYLREGVGGMRLTTSSVNAQTKSAPHVGVSNQTKSGTKVFNDTLTDADTTETTLTKLKEQYPDVFSDDNTLKKAVVQRDGTVKEIKLVKVPYPVYDGTEDKPTTTETIKYVNQVTPAPDISTLPDRIIDKINKTLGDKSDPTTPSINGGTGTGTTPESPLPSQAASALWKWYNPTTDILNSFGAYLWSTDFLDNVKKLMFDPMQAVIGLKKIYMTPHTGGSENIKVGFLDSGVASPVCDAQYVTTVCGKVDLREFFGNILDYSPYTKINLYLPFIGIVPLNPADVMRSTIQIVYKGDIVNGCCIAEVNVQRDGAGGTVYTYTGNMACEYPLTAGSYTGVISSIFSVAAGTVAGLSTGIGFNPIGLATGAGSSALSALAGGNMLNVQQSGSFAGTAGAMANKKPYLIISRPQSEINAGFPTLQGYPSNTFTALSACSGFTQVKAVHVDSVTDATQEEKEMIENALKSGVII